MQYHLFTDYYYMMLGHMIVFYQSLLSEGLIAAAVIFVIGIIFGTQFGTFAKKLVKKMGIDNIVENVGAKSFLKKGGIKFSIADLVGWFVKWFIILFALMVSVDYLGLPQVSEFLTRILNYLPSLIGAVAILTIGMIIAQMVYEALSATGKATGARIYIVAALVAKWMLIAVTFLVVLEQIGVGMSVLRIFAGGLSLMFAIAGGLAFGLGGQGHARELLDNVKNKLSGHEQ